jgi:hypothetical protein
LTVLNAGRYHFIMIQTVTIEELQIRAPELLAHLGAADEILVAAPGGAPFASIRPASRAPASAEAREMGFWIGQISTASDFDEPLPDAFWLGGVP